MRPLVLTATTVISAIGRGAAQTLAALRDRRGGLAPCDFQGIATGFIGRVPDVEDHALPPELARFDCRNNRLADLALHTDGFDAAVAAARERLGASRIAVVLGSSTSGILSTEEAYRARDPLTGAMPAGFDYEHTHEMFSLAHFLRSMLGLRGPAMTISTACASSAQAFIDARHLIEAGICDAAIVGGADSLCGMTLRGFASLELISPVPCAPCDAARAGISIGEAAGFALLERDGDGVALVGCGASSDGYHMSAPHPEAAGAVAAMRTALESARLSPADIDYVNLHGTGTRANDAMEDRAILAVFGANTACSSTKGWTGHMLGASGIVEAVISGLCLRYGFMPGGLNVAVLDPAFGANVLLHNADVPVRRAMSNAFGFGGTNCSLVFAAEA
ncbi:MAG TPA: beta-ketoacyl-[acyl-carrier-protein] synthase family protein [Acetobacteraceae bacterium]|nr:beta-ketoacyl-[acyl-carrier-protein] synthase family protein [Acetobacteraceae bacterium]